MLITVARGPSSMLQAVQGFQLGCGGDQETTPAGCGLLVTKSSKTWSDSSDTGSWLPSGCNKQSGETLTPAQCTGSNKYITDKN